MDTDTENLERLKDQLARAERSAARFQLSGDQERYLEQYFLAESLGTQLDALLVRHRSLAR